MTSVRLSHEELAKHLARSGGDFNAAEVHGLASGLLAGRVEDGDRLLAEVLPGIPNGELLATECRTVLHRLVAETATGLADDVFGFVPLLPADNTPLHERVIALRDWCEGFLYGLGVGRALPEPLPPDVREALEDIGELTRLDTAHVGATEDEEQDYAELVEFIRLAAVLIHDELHAGNSRKASRSD